MTYGAHLITHAVRAAAHVSAAPVTSGEMPPGLERMVPRDIRLKAGGRVLAVFALLIAAGSVPVTVLLELRARSDGDALRAIHEQSIETTGMIIRKWQTGRGDDARRWVAYEFSANGRVYRHESRAPSRRIWERVEAGQALPIRFMPNDPNQSWPWGREPGTMPAFLPYLAGGAMIVIAGLMTLALAQQRRLLAEGRAARATVTKHRPGSHGGKSAVYEFATLSGSRIRGTTGPSNKPTPIGTTFWILYLPDRPRRNAPYPLGLVQLAHPTRLR